MDKMTTLASSSSISSTTSKLFNKIYTDNEYNNNENIITFDGKPDDSSQSIAHYDAELQ